MDITTSDAFEASQYGSGLGPSVGLEGLQENGAVKARPVKVDGTCQAVRARNSDNEIPS